MASKPALRVSVFSDYICPFCYVGHARLRRLREQFDLKVNWCAIEIHPDTPAAGMPISALGYPPAQWRQMMAALAAMAAEEGLVLAEREFTTNSHRALLLAEAAKEQGAEVFYALHEGLFRAYFGEGRNIGDPEVLLALAAKAGLGEATVTAAWSEPRFEQRLQVYRALAQRYRLTGTPTFVIGERVLVGALPTATLAAAARATLATADVPQA